VSTRASDAERERCASVLRDHAAAGRLELAELEERLGRAYGARYRSELRALLRDLPRDHARRLARVADRVDRLLLAAHAASFGVVNGSLVGLWAATGQGDFWPAVTIAPWSVVLAWHAGGSWSVRRMLRRRAPTAGGGRRRLLA
jgi:Domain of unknown function (DUF1707)